jgi:hypothetical protein
VAADRPGTDMRGASPWHSHRSKRAPFAAAARSAPAGNSKLPWPSPRRPANHAVLLSDLCFLFRFVAPLLPDPCS